MSIGPALSTREHRPGSNARAVASLVARKASSPVRGTSFDDPRKGLRSPARGLRSPRKNRTNPTNKLRCPENEPRCSTSVRRQPTPFEQASESERRGRATVRTVPPLHARSRDVFARSPASALRSRAFIERSFGSSERAKPAHRSPRVTPPRLWSDGRRKRGSRLADRAAPLCPRADDSVASSPLSAPSGSAGALTDDEKKRLGALLREHDYPGARLVALRFAFKLTHGIGRAQELMGRVDLRLLRLGWDPGEVPLVRRLCRLVWSEWTHAVGDTEKARKAEEVYLRHLEATEGLVVPSVEQRAAALESTHASQATPRRGSRSCGRRSRRPATRSISCGSGIPSRGRRIAEDGRGERPGRRGVLRRGEAPQARRTATCSPRSAA